MIDRQALLKDLNGLLPRLEADLRERAGEHGDAPDIHGMLTAEYEKARGAERTAASFEEWRAEGITQKAAAWILSCVFARFLEDNGLVDPPRISGPGERLKRARDEHELYFRSHPTETDREYLLDVFAGLAALPAGGDVFGKHNGIHIFPGWLSGDAAGELLAFFQRIDAASGALIHDFTDESWDTRFLGDLYQDLSETARKKYALLQTPDFVEAFILDRTLSPALDEFGLDAPAITTRTGMEIAPAGFRMIDPACGPGHFLLGGFERIFRRWEEAEPAVNARVLVQRALDSVHGVDVNPFAVAIARFRLLLAALGKCGVRRLKDAPNFRINLACGDSLWHGSLDQMDLDGLMEVEHHYQIENIDDLRRILRNGRYHAVVANPPYPTVKDKALNQAYRNRYPDVCYKKYSLVVPFMQRVFNLACDDGFTGQITANSFMKREFGKKLVESYLPKIDLTHVIDASGAYIPGHGTPTVILFGRNRQPVGSRIRTVMGITGESSTPNIPSRGKVWTAITMQIDHLESQSEFVSVSDRPREQFVKHPWSIGGSGASELKNTIDATAKNKLKDYIYEIGFLGITAIDDLMVSESRVFRRSSIEKNLFQPLVTGDKVRDWCIRPVDHVIFPYKNESLLSAIEHPNFYRWIWLCRTVLGNRATFGKSTYFKEGRPWWEWHQVCLNRLRTQLSIVYGEVATHNHFALDRGDKIFKQTAPIIKLPANSAKNDHLSFLGPLNSSVAWFWMKQVFTGKHMGDGGAAHASREGQRFAFDATKLKQFPLPENRPISPAKQIDALARQLSQSLPAAIAAKSQPTQSALTDAKGKADHLIAQMIALQEELDWQCYGLYNLLSPDEAAALRTESPPPLQLGQRAFEILMARKMAAGELETTWFQRHNSTPITELPADWPDDYKRLVEARINTIQNNPRTIGLIEQPEYKRRWNLEPWDKQLEKALWRWLLDRLESYFDFDGRMNDENTPTARLDIGLTTIARLSDIARADDAFMEVAELYRRRPDFNVPALVAELVEAESVPLLPVLRYKPAGLDKRAAWERTWELGASRANSTSPRNAGSASPFAKAKTAASPSPGPDTTTSSRPGPSPNTTWTSRKKPAAARTPASRSSWPASSNSSPGSNNGTTTSTRSITREWATTTRIFSMKRRG